MDSGKTDFKSDLWTQSAAISFVLIPMLHWCEGLFNKPVQIIPDTPFT